MKKRKIYKIKGYTHFDTKKKDYWNYIKKIQDTEWIKAHAFYPFIHYEEEKKRFDGKELITKPPRDIRYSAHIDRYVYEYYNEKISIRYNKYAKKIGINQASIAYRNSLGKNNIHFSKDVFTFLHNLDNAFIIVADFSNFFDNLDHKYLKERLKEVLNVETLPDDYYKTYKSITQYSYINYEDILKELGLTHKELIKLKKERLFEPKEFRGIKKKYLHKNKKNYGIVQGSAISSVMSNIYMIKFDKMINDMITSNNGIYRRYSDDIIIVIPNIGEAFNIYDKVMEIKNQIPNLDLSPEKTKCFLKKGNIINEISPIQKRIIKKNTNINYLGFSYNGNIVKIKEKTVAKFYRKMYARIRTINKWSIKKQRNIGRKKLYKQYTYLGKNTKNVKKGNFLTYVDRAQKIYGSLGEFEPQVKKSWKNMSKKLVKIKK